MHPLGGFWLLIHEVRQAFGGRIGQPFVDRQAVAFRLRNLLALIVEEQLIGHMVGFAPAQDLADAVIDRRVGRVVFAIHFKVDIQRRPAGAEIGLPLQLHMAARDRKRPFAARLIIEGDGVVLGVDVLHWHIEDPARFGVDRQEAGIGLLTFIAQGRQHDFHNGVIAFGGQPQGVIEAAGFVEFGGGDEFIFKAEGVQKPPQHGVVVVAKAFKLLVRVGDRGERFLHVLAQHLLLGHVFGHFAHAIDIVGKADQARWDVRDHLERAADHGGTGHLAEGADMRQTGRAIAGFKQHVTFFGVFLFIAFENGARFFEGPGFRRHRGITERGHGQFLKRRRNPMFGGHLCHIAMGAGRQ